MEGYWYVGVLDWCDGHAVVHRLVLPWEVRCTMADYVVPLMILMTILAIVMLVAWSLDW